MLSCDHRCVLLSAHRRGGAIGSDFTWASGTDGGSEPTTVGWTFKVNTSVAGPRSEFREAAAPLNPRAQCAADSMLPFLALANPIPPAQLPGPDMPVRCTGTSPANSESPPSFFGVPLPASKRSVESGRHPCLRAPPSRCHLFARFGKRTSCSQR